jgi:hypothetical protein
MQDLYGLEMLIVTGCMSSIPSQDYRLYTDF